jgi:hypothetical protein
MEHIIRRGTGSLFLLWGACYDLRFPGHQFPNGRMHTLEGLEVEGLLDNGSYEGS